MKIDCIGCLHGHYPKLDGGDLLIVTGDLTARDEVNQFKLFFDWLIGQKYKKKIYIGGNHENLLKDSMPRIHYRLYSDQYPENELFEYLCDSGTEFEGLKIWGTPWTKKFKGQNPHAMAFCLDTDEEMKEKWDLLPDDIDILITHGPPYGILDKTIRNEHVGCKYLRQVLDRVKPKLWVFSHIHECGGKMIDLVMTKMVNCSHVNEYYEPVNAPVRIEIK